MKCCAKCRQTYPLDNFGLKTDSKDGHQPYCKTCIAEYRRTQRRCNGYGNEQLREDMGKLKHIQSILTRAWV